MHCIKVDKSTWNYIAISLCMIFVSSYPDLLTPAYVACSTNMGEGLVKLITCNDRPGCVEEWHIPGKTVSALPIANMDRRTTKCATSDSLGDVSWVQKAAYSCTEGMCHFSTCPGTSLHASVSPFPLR